MKIRKGFVSNSSSSSFIIQLNSLTINDINNLSMAFGKIIINDNGEILINYNCGYDLAINIINGLLCKKEFRRTNVSEN